jgi:cobalamin biosynthesis Mg chelatase CobN
MNRRRLPTVISMLEEQVRQEKMSALPKLSKKAAKRMQREAAKAEKLRRLKPGKSPAQSAASAQQQEISKETFQLPEEKPSVPKQPVDVRTREAALILPAGEETSTKTKSKRMPHTVTALIAASALTLIVSLSLSVIFQTTLLFTLGISAPVFLGLAVLFYNYLETMA